MKTILRLFIAVSLLLAATSSFAWFGNDGWGDDWNPYDEWDPRYWMEEMEDIWDDDDDYYRYGGYGPYGPGYGYGGYGPYGPGYGYGPYGPGPGYGYGPYGPAYGPGSRLWLWWLWPGLWLRPLLLIKEIFGVRVKTLIFLL